MQTHTYYRGGGFGGVYSSRSGSSAPAATATAPPSVSESPTVTADMIKDVLFPGNPRKPSKTIFGYKNSSMWERFDDNGHVKLDGRSLLDGINIEDMKIENLKNLAQNFIIKTKFEEDVEIKDEQKPVLVSSILYFWGKESLPEGDNITDCVDLSAVNDASNFTICNVASMISCQKNFADIVMIGKKNPSDETAIVKNRNGTRVDEFAWFCPPSEQCCEWECCATEEKPHSEFDPPDNDFVAMVHTIVFMSVVVSIVLIIFGCCKFAKWRESKQPVRRQQQQQNPTIEMEPLTAPHRDHPRDYPKQPGNYGWNSMPSAPPMYQA